MSALINEIQGFITRMAEREDLSEAESSRAIQIILSGGATPAQIAGFLVALRMKGETVAELAGAAKTMRAKAVPFPIAPEIAAEAIDTCGTGGDASGSYNISTAVALVAAACGAKVIKHGNRSVSSRSGSADVLESLGIRLNAGADTMQQALEEANICFLMAPHYHPSLRHVTPVRQELKMRTLFNLLGPLANPAGVTRQLLGVYSADWVMPLAETLRSLGATRALVVHGADGMDELSLTGPSIVAELRDGDIHRYEIKPEMLGLERCTLADLKGGDAQHNAEALTYLLGGAKGAYRDAVVLNSAAALLVSGLVETLEQGAERAIDALDSTAALLTLRKLVEITNAGGN